MLCCRRCRDHGNSVSFVLDVQCGRLFSKRRNQKQCLIAEISVTSAVRYWLTRGVRLLAYLLCIQSIEHQSRDRLSVNLSELGENRF